MIDVGALLRSMDRLRDFGFLAPGLHSEVTKPLRSCLVQGLMMTQKDFVYILSLLMTRHHIYLEQIIKLGAQDNFEADLLLCLSSLDEAMVNRVLVTMSSIKKAQRSLH